MPSSEPTVRDGDRTRDALIDAGAELFAAHGVDAVSIRSVNKAAGAAAAAVHYHFGSRDGLLQAILVRDGAAVAERVIELTEQLARRPQPPTARELLDVVGIPYLELLARDEVRGRRWLQVVAQLTLLEDERLARTAGRISDGLVDLVRRAFPGASRHDALLRWPIAVTTLIQMLGAAEAHDPDYRTALFDFVAGGLQNSLASLARSSVPAV